jgi:hypothetical protein
MGLYDNVLNILSIVRKKLKIIQKIHWIFNNFVMLPMFFLANFISKWLKVPWKQYNPKQ